MDIDQVAADPHKYGFPTFQEYSRNPGKFLEKFYGKESRNLDIVANGTNLEGLKQVIKNTIHEICGRRVKTLTEVETIAKDHGINLRDMEFKAAIQPIGGGDGQILVRWMPSEDIMRRSKW